MNRQAEDVRSRALDALRRPIRLTFAAMLLEQVLRAFWPLASLGLAGFAAWRWGVVATIPPGAMPLLVPVFLLAMAFLFWRGLLKVSWPDANSVTDRLDSSVSGQPIATLKDRIALGKGQAEAEELWAIHMEEMADRSRNVRVAGPDMRLARFDPLGLRLVALLAFSSALLFAWGNEPEWVSAEPGTEPEVAIPVFEGWAEPPVYTGRPTVYLGNHEGADELHLPVGTILTLRVYGSSGDLALSESISGEAVVQQPGTSDGTWQRQLVVQRSGTVELASADREIWSRSFTIIPDEPPFVEMLGRIESTVNGGMLLRYRAGDDYGVTSSQAKIALDPERIERQFGLAVEPEPRDELALDLPLPFFGGTDEFEEELTENLAEHPFAGLPVTITLEVSDAAGNTGATEPYRTRMPSRRFFDNVAASLAEQKQDLDWSRENAPRVSRILRALTYRPTELFDDASSYLLTRTALRRLDRGRSAPVGLTHEARDEIASILWRTALLIEDGNLANARERLERARDRLEAAIEQGASQSEIAELMQELRNALNDYLRELAENALENADREFADRPQGEMITSDDLHEMLDRLQQLMEQGRMAEAQELLRQLQGLMENMQASLESGVMRPGSGGDPTLDGLRDTLQQQQGLADDTFRQLQGNPGPGTIGPEGLRPPPDGMSSRQDRGDPYGGTGLSGPPGTGGQLSEQDLAARQEALREMLARQRQNLPFDDGAAGGAPLEEAEDAMSSARENLERGDNNRALDDQARAIEALRQGLREIQEARRSRAQGENVGDNGGQQNGGDFRARDPLGRQTGADGSAVSGGRALPDGEYYDRSREVLEEIRRRSNDRTRPESELDYLRRLLNRY